MAKVSNELVTRFAFTGSLAPLKEFNTSIAGSLKGLGLMAAGVTAAAGTLFNWVNNIAQANDAVGQLARTTGVTVEAIGELSFAASQNGSSAQAMQSSLSGLTQRIGEMAALGKGEGVEVFGRLGIAVRDAAGKVKTADQIFIEFQRNAQRLNLSQGEVQSLAQKLGIDPTLVQLLGKTSEEMQALREESIALGRPTREQMDQMLEYNDTISKVKTSFDSLKVNIAVGVLPQLKELATLFKDTLKANAEAITKTIKVLSSIFGALFDSLVRLWPIIWPIVAALVAVKLVLLAIASIKLILITAAIALFVVVIDDLVAAFTGADSTIARFYSDLTGGRSIVTDLTAAWDAFKYVIQSVIDYYKALWNIHKAVAKGITSFAQGTINFVGKIFGGDKVQPETQAMLPPAGATSNSSINQEVKIEIKTSDPQAAGVAAADTMQSHLRNAQMQAGVQTR